MGTTSMLLAACAATLMCCISAIRVTAATIDDERKARADAIARTLAAIDQELAANGGSFEAWGAKLKAFRDDVRQVIARARPVKGNFNISSPEKDLLLLDTLDGLDADHQVFKAVLHLDRQLKARGIDLVFLPIPDKGAVYPDVLSDNVPADGTVAIQVKHLLKKLLENDVECIDMYNVYRDFRRQTGGKVPLYYESQDIHWRNKGAQLCGQTIAERLKRYGFVQQALAAGNPFKGEPFKREGGVKADNVLAVVNTKTDSHYVDVDDSPVVVTADSYGTYCFLLKDAEGKTHDGHLTGQVALNIGVPVTYLHKQGLWGDMPVFLAQQEQQKGYLKGRRVIVFTCIARSFKLSKWPIVDLPAASGDRAATGPAAADGPVIARGVVNEVSPRPAKGADYPNYVMSVYVTKLVDEKGQVVGAGDAVVRILAMKNRQILPIAAVQTGAALKLKLLPLSVGEAQYPRVMTGVLPTADLNIKKRAYWAEVAEP